MPTTREAARAQGRAIATRIDLRERLRRVVERLDDDCLLSLIQTARRLEDGVIRPGGERDATR